MGKPHRAARIVAVTAVGALSAVAVLAASGVGPAVAADEATSYEALASAEGVRLSVSAPKFVAVETFIDGGGPVSQAAVDGLGNSHAYAALPYPGDLLLTGPGLLAGVTGLPSPPAYPFYVSSSYPTMTEGKMAQPGYELSATSGETSSQSTATTGVAAGGSAVGRTVTNAAVGREAATGAVTAEAAATADAINIGGVLRIGQVEALARVTRSPGEEPVRHAAFTVNGMTIADQTVGVSEQGFTFGGTTTPIPAGDPLTEVLKQAKITVQYVDRVDDPDGVVSPGLVITQEQQLPSGPTVVLRYVFGRMAASATVSGSSTSIASGVPVENGSPDAVVDPGSPAPPEASPVPTPVIRNDVPLNGSGAYGDTPTGASPDGAAPSVPVAADTNAAVAVEVPGPTPPLPSAGERQLASPIAQPVLRVDTVSVYGILVLGALTALGGGLLLRLVGVKLKWGS